MQRRLGCARADPNDHRGSLGFSRALKQREDIDRVEVPTIDNEEAKDCIRNRIDLRV